MERVTIPGPVIKLHEYIRSPRPLAGLLDLPEAGFRTSLILLSIIVLSLIALLKLQSAPSIFSDLPVFIYTVFVTTFLLSRIVIALRYTRSLSNVIPADLGKTYEPRVTFVIPCKNEEQAIGTTVEKCFSVDYPIDKIQVIVINDGSTDNTIDVLREAEKQFDNLVIIDWEQNRGKRHGMYEGIQRSSGEIVIQLDSDSYLHSKDFRNFIEPFRNPEVGAVCAHADPANADENLITKMQAAFYFMSFRIMKAAESVTSTVFCCSGCASAYKKSVILPIMDQWLAESFLGRPVTWGDDRSLTSWVLKTGYKTLYTDQVQAYTIVPNTWSQLLKQQLRWKKGWIVNATITSRFIFRTHPLTALLYYFPLVVISFLTPIMAFRALIYGPLVHGTMPIFYLSGVFLITSIMVLFYRSVSRRNKYWPYLFLWSLFNLFILSYLMFYAVLRLQDRSWVTR